MITNAVIRKNRVKNCYEMHNDFQKETNFIYLFMSSFRQSYKLSSSGNKKKEVLTNVVFVSRSLLSSDELSPKQIKINCCQ